MGNELVSSVSSIRFKRDVVDYAADLSRFNELRVVTYKPEAGYEEATGKEESRYVSLSLSLCGGGQHTISGVCDLRER